jgi:hypothetical protein
LGVGRRASWRVKSAASEFVLDLTWINFCFEIAFAGVTTTI